MSASDRIRDIDYAQEEAKIMSIIMEIRSSPNDEECLIDIHTGLASRYFEVPADEVTPEQRRMAKAVNFAIHYEPTGTSTGRMK